VSLHSNHDGLLDADGQATLRPVGVPLEDKGLTKSALADMVKQASTANNDRPGLNYLNSPGYMPHDGSYGCCNFYGPVATTLEYNTADFALSAMAGALGDTANQKTYANRAQDWRNTLNPASGFVEPEWRPAPGRRTGAAVPRPGGRRG
jgi:putative alpha-1,2-mannosidase